MVHACSVYGCASTAKCNTDLRFHRFPRDARSQLWIDACRRPDLKDKNIEQLYNMYVCSLHFEVWMYMKKKLKSAAIPVLNLPSVSINPMSTQTEAPKIESLRDLHSRGVQNQIEVTSVDVSVPASTSDQASESTEKLIDPTPRKELKSCSKKLKLMEDAQCTRKLFLQGCDQFLSPDLSNTVKAQVWIGEMSKVDIEKFIECVKKYPVLYDRRHEFYNNYDRKTKTWRLVGKEMDESGEVLRIKWKGLKDGYRKYKRFHDGVAPSYRQWRGWVWGEYLRFLDDYDMNRPVLFCKSRSTTSTPDKESQENIETGQWTGISSASEYRPGDSTRSATDEEFEAKRPKLDSVDHLFSSYAETFRKFRLRTQCMLKIQMAKIFADAELAEFDVSEVLGSDGSGKEKDCLDIKIEESSLFKIVDNTHVKQERTGVSLNSNGV